MPIPYLCIFRYTTKVSFCIPLNILILSKLAACLSVSYYSYAPFHGSRGNLKIQVIKNENLLKHFQILFYYFQTFLNISLKTENYMILYFVYISRKDYLLQICQRKPRQSFILICPTKHGQINLKCVKYELHYPNQSKQ